MRRGGLLCSGIVTVAALCPTVASAAPTVTEFGSLSASTEGIATGPDGAMWFTEINDPGRIGRSTSTGPPAEVATGGVTPGFTANRAPALIAPGPDGNLWFTEDAGAGAVGRITPAHVVTEFSAGLPATPTLFDIAAGPDGNVWFTGLADPGRILRVTPSTGAIVTVATGGVTSGFTANATPLGIVAGADGNLWFTERSPPGRLGRITPGGAVTEFTSGLTPNRGPDRVALGPDGNVWFTEQEPPGAIGRITPAGAITEFTSGLTPDSIPTGIAAGADGKVWFTEQADPGRIGRIDPSTGQINEYTAGLTPNSAPVTITAGSDGRMWFTEGAAARLGRISIGPGATTSAATNVGPTSATLNGSVRPNSQATTVHFEYGTTTSYGSATPETAAGSGAGPAAVPAAVGGLTPGTTYHYRLVASNDSDTTSGADQAFATALASSGPASTLVPPMPVLPLPSCTVSVARKQNALLTTGTIRAVTRCDQAVSAKLGGTVTDTPRRTRRARLGVGTQTRAKPRSFALTAPVLPVAANRSVTLTARLAKRGFKRVRAGLIRRDRISAEVALTVTDSAGRAVTASTRTPRIVAKRKRKHKPRR
jgi:streptogramin lyase